MNSTKNASAKRGGRRKSPEERLFDQLKGELVRIVYVNEDTWIGQLVWVDRFTVGVRATPDADVHMVYKHGIKTLERWDESYDETTTATW